MQEPKYVTSPDFILRQIGDESILVPIGDAGELENSIVSFNETYSFIWDQFTEPRTIPEVIAIAEGEYDDPEGVMSKHITEATMELVKRNILKAVD